MTLTKKMLNEWDGYVESIDTNATFTAVLQDTKLPDGKLELAEFPIALLSERDSAGLEVGRYLKFEIFQVGKQVRSRVWLRRWRWSKRELISADRKAKKWSELFGNAPLQSKP